MSDSSDATPSVGSWIDNHCHLDGEPDPAAIVADARASGVVAMITVGTTTERSKECISLARDLPGVYATVGVHPHDATEGTAELRDVVESAGRDDPGLVVAIGECGLDYFYDHSPREVQRSAFAAQIGLAHDLGLPLVIHTRDAWADTFDILEQEGVPERTVFHCFTGGPDEADRGLALGAKLSVSGIVTFPTATALRAAVAEAPLDQLMVETDSPYLAPVPHRGRRNRPGLVPVIGAEVASLQQRTLSEVAVATSRTATDFYGLDR
jgi:TatD DNase family protein